MANDVQYITFENGAPRAQFPGNWTDDDKIRGHLKSEQFENSMAETRLACTSTALIQSIS